MRRRDFIQATLLFVTTPWADSLSAKDHGYVDLSGRDPTEEVYRWVDGLTAKDNGYRGIWDEDTATHDQYVYKYSGGLATFPLQQLPITVYFEQAQKTFFCYSRSLKSFVRGLAMPRDVPRCFVTVEEIPCSVVQGKMLNCSLFSLPAAFRQGSRQ